MRADGDELSPPAQVLVQLVLEVDERVVRQLGELDVAEHCAREVRADLRGLHHANG